MRWSSWTRSGELSARGDRERRWRRAKSAVDPLLRAIAVNPYDPSAHCSLAEAYRRLPDASPEKLKRAERDCRELGKP